ncbi:MAG: HAMP domain-containing sensor histidine kinase [Deltaproteobacteria bacterium]|nr:HAMP domain-containing sensor histidine kinase [Deltaproteobacteria bacterium]
MESQDELTFSDVLASTMHDTKNSLGMLYNTLEEMIGRCQEKRCDVQHEFFLLQYEIKRLNNILIRLLTLYKAKKNQLLINLDLHRVGDCLEESVVQNAPLLNSRGIEIDLDCPGDLFWVFDYSLVLGVIDNIMNNTYRYTRDKVRISAVREEAFLVIRIEDNGPGYPPQLLRQGNSTIHDGNPVSFDTGSTGLGLYFSCLVAKSHNNGERKGYFLTENGGSLGGGRFSLYIP